MKAINQFTIINYFKANSTLKFLEELIVGESVFVLFWMNILYITNKKKKRG
jgi:hypothetical protein